MKMIRMRFVMKNLARQELVLRFVLFSHVDLHLHAELSLNQPSRWSSKIPLSKAILQARRRLKAF